MKEFIVTISDDLDIFETLADAEKYLEPWILESKYNFKAFSQNGNIVKASVQSGTRIKLLVTEDKDPSSLKEEVLNYIPRLGPANLVELRMKSTDELISFLVKTKGFTK
jgi:hypothetical protein